MADMMFVGEGLEKDQTEAVRGWMIAAKNGNIPSYRNIANAYAYGEGVEKDIKKAIEYYEKAADAGDPQSLFVLGNRYCRGDGVERNSELGFSLLEQAAEQGLWTACTVLSSLSFIILCLFRVTECSV